MSRDSKLEPAFKAIRQEAQERRVKVDKSFFTELENYSLHRKVRSRPEGELRTVIENLGKAAIGKVDDRAGGGHVRAVIDWLCNDPFSDCYGAYREARAQTDAQKLIERMKEKDRTRLGAEVADRGRGAAGE